MKENRNNADESSRTQWWTKYVLTERPENPTWDEVHNLLSFCDTFSWIPKTEACEVNIYIRVFKNQISHLFYRCFKPLMYQKK